MGFGGRDVKKGSWIGSVHRRRTKTAISPELRGKGLSRRSASRFTFGNPAFHSLDDLAQGRIERVCDFPKAADRWVDDAPFDAADVSSVEAAFGTEGFLRLARLLPEFAQHDADRLLFQGDRLDVPLWTLRGQISMVVSWRI